jgi:hypothetical protein
LAWAVQEEQGTLPVQRQLWEEILYFLPLLQRAAVLAQERVTLEIRAEEMVDQVVAAVEVLLN